MMVPCQRLFDPSRRSDRRDGLPSDGVELLLMPMSKLMGREIAEEQKLSIGVLRCPPLRLANAI